MDVVSGGEYKRARDAGVDGSRIVFSGVGKTGAEMKLALHEGCDSLTLSLRRNY